MHGDIIESMREDPAATTLREVYSVGREILGTVQDVGKLRTLMGRYNKGGVEKVPRSSSVPSYQYEETWRYNKRGQPTKHTTTHSPYNSEQEYFDNLKSGNW